MRELCSGFGVQDARIWGLECWVQAIGFQGAGFGVKGLMNRVWVQFRGTKKELLLASSSNSQLSMSSPPALVWFGWGGHECVALHSQLSGLNVFFLENAFACSYTPRSVILEVYSNGLASQCPPILFLTSSLFFAHVAHIPQQATQRSLHN